MSPVMGCVVVIARVLGGPWDERHATAPRGTALRKEAQRCRTAPAEAGGPAKARPKKARTVWLRLPQLGPRAQRLCPLQGHSCGCADQRRALFTFRPGKVTAGLRVLALARQPVRGRSETGEVRRHEAALRTRVKAGRVFAEKAQGILVHAVTEVLAGEELALGFLRQVGDPDHATLDQHVDQVFQHTDQVGVQGGKVVWCRCRGGCAGDRRRCSASRRRQSLDRGMGRPGRARRTWATAGGAPAAGTGAGVPA